MASVTEKESEAPRLVLSTPSLLSYHLSLLRGPRSGIPVAGCWCWVLGTGAGSGAVLGIGAGADARRRRAISWRKEP